MSAAGLFVGVTSLGALGVALHAVRRTAKRPFEETPPSELVEASPAFGEARALIDDTEDPRDEDLTLQRFSVSEIGQAIKEGAISFLFREYLYMGWFMVIFGLILFGFLGIAEDWKRAGFTVIAFLLGAMTSIVSGYIGMRISV